MNITFALVPPFSLRHRPRPARSGRAIVAISSAIVLLIGCGSAADSEIAGNGIPSGYPTIASADFQGAFEITGATVDGRSLDLGAASSRQVTFDVVTGAATVDLGCDRRLGSFTLDADGRASITLTGRIEVEPCSPSDVDDALVDLIERVERWERAGDGFQLVAAGGDSLVLSGA